MCVCFDDTCAVLGGGRSLRARHLPHTKCLNVSSRLPHSTACGRVQRQVRWSNSTCCATTPLPTPTCSKSVATRSRCPPLSLYAFTRSKVRMLLHGTYRAGSHVDIDGSIGCVLLSPRLVLDQGAGSRLCDADSGLGPRIGRKGAFHRFQLLSTRRCFQGYCGVCSLRSTVSLLFFCYLFPFLCLFWVSSVSVPFFSFFSVLLCSFLTFSFCCLFS